MNITNVAAENKKDGFLDEGFNKSKTFGPFDTPKNTTFVTLQQTGKKQCTGKYPWPQIDIVNAWMLSAETATFMKCGGLGMVASELPENFNRVFGANSHSISIVTPLYLGNTGKKSASLKDLVYTGAENRSATLEKIATISVDFTDADDTPVQVPTEIYRGQVNGVTYIFLRNDTYFSINPHPQTPPTQDGCYILNKHNVNEVERFAFFSKAVCVLLESCINGTINSLKAPNILITNDWHSGAVAGLCKYLPLVKADSGLIERQTAEILRDLPIIHIAHHLGYQGWDYPNTARILNALYGQFTEVIFKNAKAVKNANPRTNNTLIVYDCYNQSASNMHLADRIVTVSCNYMEEVSKELSFGFDFRDILKIRKNHRTFFGIVNGYEKNLISPNPEKIERINDYFKDTQFKVYTADSSENKRANKRECIRLLSKLATDQAYKKSVIPLIDVYRFKNIERLIKKADNIPFVCATSRLVAQKGYDVAAESILKIINLYKQTGAEYPICVLGGAGDTEQYAILQNLKNEAEKIDSKASDRIFVFRGYRDEFAYALQLAADFYLMPSRFEPCGLTQMEAMAKGCLPIAMSTGGLVDTIEDGQTGFRTAVFYANGERIYGSNTQAHVLKNNVDAYAATMERAFECFADHPQALRDMVQNAMQKDFGWSVEGGSLYKYYHLLKTGSI